MREAIHTHSRHGVALLIGVLGTVALPFLSASLPAMAAGGKAVLQGRGPAPRVVNVRTLPAASGGSATQLPFYPRSASGFKAAKLAAQAGKTGRRTGVISPTANASTSSSTASSPNASSGKSLQVGAAFPLVNRDTEVSWFGAEQNVAPPDTQLAAGGDQLVEALNSTGSVWSKTGSLLDHFDLYSLFGVPGGQGFSDPRIRYDDLSGLWFLSGLAFAITPTSVSSTVYLAISQSSDPTGLWGIYQISVSNIVIQDQPKFGVTFDKVVMTWDDFNSGGTFIGQQTVIMQKSDLLARVPPRWATLLPAVDQSRFNLIPVQQQDGSSAAYLVYNLFDSNGSSTGQAGVITITGTPANGDLVWSETDVDITPTSAPPGARQGSPITYPLLATNDDSFISATVMNGILWLGGNDACQVPIDPTTRSCVRLIQLSLAGQPGLLQDVDLGASGGFLFFPAVSVNRSGDMVVVYTQSGDASFAGVGAAGQPAVGPGSFEIRGIQDGLGAYSCGTCASAAFNNEERWGDYSGASQDPATGDIWVAGEYGTATPGPATTNSDWGTAAGRISFSSSVLQTAFSNQQYQLTGSNGSSWIVMDPTRLVVTLAATSNVSAIVDANADLWTGAAGVNQDIGIYVSTNGGTPTLLAWKESGGKAGTFSPNAAFLHTVKDLTSGNTYTFALRWKTNVPTNSTIFAGAGLGPVFSPTRLTARLVESGSSEVTALSTQQYKLATDQSWTDMDPTNLALDVPPTANAMAIIHANADLWTANAGFNQDLGIDVKVLNNPDQIVSWKESGGRAGTFSPNAAYAQAIVDPSSGFHVKLQWKPNVQLAGGTIFAGAGLGPAFSPTRLTVELVPASSVYSSASLPAQQYTLANSDGVSWLSPDVAALHLMITPTSDCLAVVGVNVDLWTENAGVNQDIGLQVQAAGSDIAYAPQVLAWKESGGSAGTFSPNAAYLETVLPIFHTGGPARYDLYVVWKANHATTGTIHANAGLPGNFSPTRITAELICS
jgi:hypothetical protein